jgi:hypothetical protein
MPGFKVDTKLRKKGPIFENPTARIEAFLNVSEEEVATVGKNMVLDRLEVVLQNPSGYYESQIQTERVSDGWEVNDSRRVLYGPWLEGTGSRNASTRFKGYRTFRIVKQDLDTQTPNILRPLIRDLLRDLGGSGE